MIEQDTSRHELAQAQEIFNVAVSKTEPVWSEGLGFPNSIESANFSVLPDQEYQETVKKLTEDDSHTTRIKAGIPQAIARSGAVAIPGADKVFVNLQYVNVLTGKEGKHPTLRLAAGVAHESVHWLAIKNSKVISGDEINACAGPSSFQHLQEHFSAHEDITYIQVGPAIEVRSGGKLVDILALGASEYLADLARFAVLINTPDSPYTAKDVAGYIIYPGGFIGRNYNELAIEGNNGERQIIYLMALLISQSMSSQTLGQYIRQGLTNLNEWLHDPVSDLIDNEVLARCTQIMFQGANDQELGQTLHILLTQNIRNHSFNQVQQYVLGELF